MADPTIISREDANVLIPADQQKEIVQGAIRNSVVLTRMRKLPDLSSNTRTMPVLSMLPMAGFVNGDTGLKPTSKLAWKNKIIYAEEIAVIIPVPENVLDDAADNGYDIWGEVTPLVQQAFGQVIDNAIIFGKDKPSTWRKSLYDSIIEQGFKVTESGDLYADILGENGVFGKVEESGYEVTGCLAGVRFKSTLRGVRDENKRPIFQSDMQNTTRYALDGAPVTFSANGTWDNTKVKMIAGDLSQAVYAIRKDITAKVLTESVITDSDGKVILNLAQQDAVAMRFVMRLGWELPNPINAEKPTEAERLPFAALVPASASTPAEPEEGEEEGGGQT